MRARAAERARAPATRQAAAETWRSLLAGGLIEPLRICASDPLSLRLLAIPIVMT